MTAYKYKALSPNGKKVSGVVEAYDEFEAVAQIKTECDVVLSIEPIPENTKERININEPLWISEAVLSLTASQFAILIRSGLPTARTVEVVAQQSTDRLMQKILKKVAKDVAAGYSLARSLENHGKKIPLTFIETVRAGEDSGTLDQAFDKLAKYYDKSNKLKKKVKSAMTYPIILIVLSIIVIIVVVNVTVPTIAGIISDAGGVLPLPTRILLGVYNFFAKWWPVVLGLIAALIIFYRVWSRTESGRLTTAKWAYHLPVIGNITIMNAAAQFASTMTTLLSSGLQTSRALSISGKVMSNYAAGTSVAACTPKIEEGRRLGEALADNPYLPPLLKEMAAVGEESGALEDTLTTIGEYFDSETVQATNKAISLLEPTLTIVLGVVIGFIVIALYLPMFTMYNGM